MSTYTGAIGSYSEYGSLVTYGSRVLTETSPAQVFVEPVTLAEAKAHLVLPDRSPVDSAEDAYIKSLISAARAVAEEESELELILRQWDVHYDYWPGCIEIGKPLVSVDLIRYRDSSGAYTTLVADQDYIADTVKKPGIVLPAYNTTWPTFTGWPSSAVLVRATTGYQVASSWWTGEIGQKIRQGMLLLVAEWFNNRIPYDTPVKEYPFPLRILLTGGSPPRAR